MNSLRTLTEATRTLQNSYVTDWLNQGKKVMGYVCTYIPEELFYAADILPYRITGKGVDDTSRADAYLTRVNCSFCRSLLELGFNGKYDFLEGAVFMNGCDHIRRAYDNWEAHNTARPFMYMLPIPHRLTPRGLLWYKEEVTSVKEAIESHFSVKITSDRLAEATLMCNETRRMVRKLYDMRAGEDPPLTGAEALTITSAAAAMPKTEFNQILGQLLEEIESRPERANGKTRLFISGSLMDDTEFIENVEDLGAIVVSDTLCFGARNFWTLTDEEGDPFDALCERYYYHEPCPRMAGEYSRRLAFAKEQIERARADGAILEAIKFCDMHGTDNALMKFHLEKGGVPVIELERQYGPLTDAGRIRTRVQAFLERIGR